MWIQQQQFSPFWFDHNLECSLVYLVYLVFLFIHKSFGFTASVFQIKSLKNLFIVEVYYCPCVEINAIFITLKPETSYLNHNVIMIHMTLKHYHHCLKG